MSAPPLVASGPLHPAAPAFKALACTPSVTPIGPTRGIYVGSAGDLVVLMAGDTAAVTFRSVNAGTLLPIAVASILPATTAGSLIALY